MGHPDDYGTQAGDCGRTIPQQPGSQPYPTELQDVAFPYSEACKAIATCRRIASMLDKDLTARVDMVASCTKHWRGPHREDFDTTRDDLDIRVVALKDDLSTLAGLLEDAWDEVEETNQRRQSTRESDGYDPRDYDPYSGR